MQEAAQSQGTVVVAEPDPRECERLLRALRAARYHVQAVHHGDELLSVGSQLGPDVVLVNWRLEQAQGGGLLHALREALPQASILALTEASAPPSLEAALGAGADRLLTKPLAEPALLAVLARSLEKPRLARLVATRPPPGAPTTGAAVGGLIGAHPSMQRVFNRVLQAARSRATILVHGETGTGKELIAAAIHQSSPRAAGPFVRLNCAALADSLLESELFGHEKGAFTGASSRRVGRLEQAAGGTLLLDEISELPLPTQVKLLRFLQERELERVGGNETIHVDVRVLAATNKDLRVLVDDGRLREDLYYRLDVVRIEVPPLRARPSDIPLLAEHFLTRFSAEHDRAVQGFSPEAMRCLLDYPWPGNVRELQNVVEQAVVLSSAPLIGVDDLAIQHASELGEVAPLMIPGVTLAELERYAILKTLDALNGSRARAAEVLGISRRTLQYRLQEWGVEPRRPRRR